MYIKCEMFRVTYFIFVLFISLTVVATAEVVNKFKVKGNDRVSSQTIINFTKIEPGSNLSKSDLNNSLKFLYETNFFENVSFKIENGLLIIDVKELPIIQSVTFNGIKAKKTQKLLMDQIKLKEKNPYNKLFLKNDLNILLNIFKESGYYFAKIEVKEETNANNTVNIIYDIDRGERALIKEIKFIGNKRFKDRKLHSVITSEESRFWKFISRGKYLNNERVDLDLRLLKNFYLNKGYYQVNIENAYSKILDKENFSLIYKIDAGEKFVFNDLSLLMPDDFDPKKFEKIEKIFKKLKNTNYSFKRIEKILDEIDMIATYENYEFIDADVIETIVEKNKINFTFDIKESEKFYVERINIFGNNITQEDYIRHQLIVDEGDPFNVLLHNKSINKLKSKGIFASVDSKIRNSQNSNQKIVDLTFEEKPTGEISAGAGYGTSGSTFALGIKENNFNGKGIKLEANLGLTEETIKGAFRYTNPNFAYSERALSTSIESTVTDKEADSGYKSSLNALSLGTSYEQYEDLFFSPQFSISNESLSTTSKASANYKKQEGSYFDTTFSYGLTYDKRNSPYQATDGFVSRWTQSLPIVSDGSPITNGYQITGYQELVDDMVVSLGFYGRAVNSLTDNDVRVSKRLYLPNRRLRGFESGKVGPKDGNDYVGGNYVTAINASSTVPFIFQTMEKVDLKLFVDTANIWGVDYSSSIDDSNKIRSSFGAAVELLTPVGPLSFSLAQPISKASTDKTETFRFQLGTTF
jgi:outer membrane protein insertion porin family